MEKITINLIPAEFAQKQRTQGRYGRLQLVGILLVLLVFLLASITFALSIIQNQNINVLAGNVKKLEDKVASYREKEGALLLLKNRLTNIGSHKSESRPRLIYEFVSSNIPEGIYTSSISINSGGYVLISASTQQKDSLDEFINSVVRSEEGKALIASAVFENLNRGRDGLYRVNIKITAK